MPILNLIEAINHALATALTADANVVLLGQDIGKNGGVFRATLGLQASFGAERILDTPLAENMLAGLAVGMAMAGLKPVVEIQFMGFIYAALEQLNNHAARMRHRTQGRLHCPLVLRTPYGAGIHAPEHHSDSLESLVAHIPGLRVVVPSSPAKAYGLLRAAILDPDPVVFLEPTRSYRLFKEECDLSSAPLPLDTSFILRSGSDVTLISWGAMLYETLQVAELLVAEQINAEVIDLASLRPLDMQTILTSVAKTGRCVIVQEASKSCSVASEIAAELAEHGLMHLLAPIQRVSGYDTVVPLSQHERYYLPDRQRILRAVRRVLEYC
jgi:2-oxoisovalerate dehydrogenase E1 component beta subunit